MSWWRRLLAPDEAVTFDLELEALISRWQNAKIMEQRVLTPEQIATTLRIHANMLYDEDAAPAPAAARKRKR